MKRDRETTDPGLGPATTARGDTLVDLPRRRQEMRYDTDPGIDIPVSDADRALLRNLVEADRRRSNEPPSRLFENAFADIKEREAPALPSAAPFSVGPRSMTERIIRRSGRWLIAIVGALVVFIAAALVLRDPDVGQNRYQSMAAKSVYLGARPPPSAPASVTPPATAVQAPSAPGPVPSAPTSAAPSSRPIVKGAPSAAPAPEPSSNKPRLEGLRHP